MSIMRGRLRKFFSCFQLDNGAGGGYRAKTVNFADDDGGFEERVEGGGEPEEKIESRLKRKNTPHPLKGSALTMNPTTAQEKVSEILQRVAATNGPPPPVQNSITLVNGGSGEKMPLFAHLERQTLVIVRTDQGEWIDIYISIIDLGLISDH